jgi:LysR family transcriptional regulator, carnitine catabolism transcriptional activator
MQINLSTRQLRAFIALAHEKNFTRAATASHLSQPAFSALIRQLEEALGVRLFDRTTRMVSFTREGSDFADAARRVLDEFEAALTVVSDGAALRKGRISIALLPSLAADWLPGVLAGFRSAHPGIETHVADILSEPCIDAVRSGRADFALAATRADTPELSAQRFCSDDFYLVCRPGHPLLELKTLRPKDVAEWPFVHLSRTSSVRQYIDGATKPRAFTSIMEVDQLATVSGMVRAGLGVSIVPGLTLYQFRAPGLATRPVHWKGLTRIIYIVQRRDRALSIAAQAFRDWMLAHPPTPQSHAHT